MVLLGSYQVPAAAVLLGGGLLACFAGYRLFRLVLGVYGFIFGALFATSAVAPASDQTLIVAALAGGAVGAIALMLGYFVGVALAGAALGGLAAHVIWGQSGWGDPSALSLLVLAAAGSVLAVSFQRYVLVAGTAFAGAWTAVVGALTLATTATGAHAGTPVEGWANHSFDPTHGGWRTLAWLAIATCGLLFQLRTRRPRR